jgi:hypothetical protein
MRKEATEMMLTYLGEDADTLDGFEFLPMAEAGEFAHWTIVHRIAGMAGGSETAGLAEWALSIQERHLRAAMAGSLELAELEDPNAPE